MSGAAPLRGLRGVLLAQCWPDEFDRVQELIDRRPGLGTVVTTAQVDVAQYVAARRTGPLLVDAARYTGAARLPASAPFRLSWLSMQRDLGLPVLTDSGYVAEGDYEGLASILGRTAQLGAGAVATLPLSSWWLRRPKSLDFLEERVTAAQVPIAIALEHREDPLGAYSTLRGLLRLVAVGVPVVQLRCDVSAVGLLCHGALAAAVGTRSNLRHFYPQSARRGGPVRAKTATLVRDCLAYVDINRIALAVQTNPDNLLWNGCDCQTCHGNPLDWIATLSDPEQQERAAFGHALEALFALRDGLLTSTSSLGDRQVSWWHACDSALFHYTGLQHGEVGWSPPKALRAWQRIPTAPSTADLNRTNFDRPDRYRR